jgi:restriction system protein
MGRALPNFLKILTSSIADLTRRWRNRWSARGYNTQTNPLRIASISGAELEMLIAESFRRAGFTVSHSVSGGPDGEWDLVLRRHGSMYLVQCKFWRMQSVGVRCLRELHDVITLHGADGGYLVSSGSFTAAAAAYATDASIELIDGLRLSKIIFDIDDPHRGSVLPADAGVPSGRMPRRDIAAPDCPQCGSTMMRRTAKRGPAAGAGFWICGASPDCGGTRVDWGAERRRAG